MKKCANADCEPQGLMSMACFLLPQSPRWLIMHNQRHQAMHNMELLDFAREEIEEDLYNHPVMPERPEAAISWKGVADIFRKPYRFRSVLALFVLGMVQLCGIDGVLYVSWLTPVFCVRYSLTTIV